MSGRRITCVEADALITGLVVSSGLTDSEAGLYLRTWSDGDGDVLRDEVGPGEGCKHWDLRQEPTP